VADKKGKLTRKLGGIMLLLILFRKGSAGCYYGLNGGFIIENS